MSDIDNTHNLVGTFRDQTLAIVSKMMGKDWRTLKEARQMELMAEAESNGRELVTRLVNIVAAEDRPTLVAKCESVVVSGDKLRATFTMDRTDPMRFDLVDAAGKMLLVVVTDAERYTATGDRPSVSPDQDDLEAAIARKREQDSEVEIIQPEDIEKPKRGRRAKAPEPIQEVEPEPEDNGGGYGEDQGEDEGGYGDDEGGYGGDDDHDESMSEEVEREDEEREEDEGEETVEEVVEEPVAAEPAPARRGRRPASDTSSGTDATPRTAQRGRRGAGVDDAPKGLDQASRGSGSGRGGRGQKASGHSTPVAPQKPAEAPVRGSRRPGAPKPAEAPQAAPRRGEKQVTPNFKGGAAPAGRKVNTEAVARRGRR